MMKKRSVVVLSFLVLFIFCVDFVFAATCDGARLNYNSCQSYCNQFNHNVSSFQMQSPPTNSVYGSSGLCLCSNYLQDNIGCPEILNSTWQPEINCSVALETIGRCGDFCKSKGTNFIGTWSNFKSPLYSCLCFDSSKVWDSSFKNSNVAGQESYIIASCKTSDAFCSDSDGGINPYVKGTLTSNPKYSGGSNFEVVDSCSEANSHDVLDWYCAGTVPYLEIQTCPNGALCQDGVCLSNSSQNLTNQTSNNSTTSQNQTTSSTSPSVLTSGGGGGVSSGNANPNKNVSSGLGNSAKVNQQPVVSSGGGGESSTFNVDTQESKVIGSGGVVVASVIQISSSEGKAYATKGDGVKTEIKVDPTNAVNLVKENLKAADIKEVKMVEYKSKVVYEISAEKQVKILALIKSNMEIKTNVDVESGEIIGVEKPWWGFLASGA